MRLPQVGDLVRLLPIGGGKPHEDLLGLVLGYETKGAMRSKVQVVWTSSGSFVYCYSTSRLKVVK